MGKRSLSFVALVLSAVQVMSCQQHSSFNPSLAGTFFPLQPNLSWTYRVFDRSRGVTTTFTDRVVEQRRSGSRIADAVESEYFGPAGRFSATTLYFPEGGYFTRQSSYGKDARVLFAERAFLPQLLKPDLTWSNSLAPFEYEPSAFRITQQHRTFFEGGAVVVPAGRFSDCIRIKTQALYQGDSAGGELPLRLEYLDWYAPHIGLVKTLVRQSGFFGSELARIELVNFGYTQVETEPSSSKRATNVSVQISSIPGMMHE
jgi:hypothetical protein